jgi:YfiH family protein
MNLIWADWPAPASVKAVTTTRTGGVSEAPYNQLNLGDHVGDDPVSVATNRQRLLTHLNLQQPAQWLKQVHGTQVIEAQSDSIVREADALFSRDKGVACVIMTADCLPVFLTNSDGSQVAAAHAGWRGLVSGVLEATVATFEQPNSLYAWLGPAIGPEAFEVGQEVYDAFVADMPEAEAAFKVSPSHSDRWLADIYQLARLRLQRAGVTAIYGGDFCTFSDADRFYSYRREAVTGRMASLIWIE